MNKIITQEEARSQGLKRFYPGQRCKRGHLSERYVRDGACMVCKALSKGDGDAQSIKRGPYHLMTDRKPSRAVNPTRGAAFPVEMKRLMGRR